MIYFGAEKFTGIIDNIEINPSGKSKIVEIINVEHLDCPRIPTYPSDPWRLYTIIRASAGIGIDGECTRNR